MSAARAYRFDEPHEIAVGRHLLRWEPPDTMFITYHGDLDVEAFRRITEVSRPLTVPRPYVLILIDMSDVGRISAETRRHSPEGARGVTFRGIAIYGASPLMRTVSALVARATDILTGNTDNPTRFFANEAEARAFLDERRRALRAQGILPSR